MHACSLLPEAVDATGEGADESLELKHREVGRDLGIRSACLRDEEVDMEAVLGCLQPGEQVALRLREVVHESDEFHLDGLFLGVLRGPRHRFDEVVGVKDELCFLAPDEEVASERGVIGGSSGEGKQFAIIIKRIAGSTETSAFLFALNDDDGIRHAGDDAVTLEEVRRERSRALRIFGDESSVLHGGIGFAEMLIRVHQVQAVGEDHDGRHAELESGSMRRYIDAIGTSGNDSKGIELRGEVAHEVTGEFLSAFGRPSSADDSDDMSAHRRDIPLHEQLCGLVKTLPETIRIFLIVRPPNADGILHFYLSIGEVDLNAIAQVAGISEPRNDIFLLVQHRIHRRAPKGDVRAVAQCPSHTFNSLRRSDGAA